MGLARRILRPGWPVVVTVLALLAFGVVIATGAASRDGGPSRSSFVVSADAVCARGKTALASANPAADASRQAQLSALRSRRKIFEMEIQELEQLARPEADTTTIGQIIQLRRRERWAVRSAIRVLQAADISSTGPPTTPVDSERAEKARSYGLSDCAE